MRIPRYSWFCVQFLWRKVQRKQSILWSFFIAPLSIPSIPDARRQEIHLVSSLCLSHWELRISNFSNQREQWTYYSRKDYFLTCRRSITREVSSLQHHRFFVDDEFMRLEFTEVSHMHMDSRCWYPRTYFFVYSAGDAEIIMESLGDTLPTMIHPLMFVPNVKALCSEEQRQHWLPRCHSMNVGVYATYCSNGEFFGICASGQKYRSGTSVLMCRPHANVLKVARVVVWWVKIGQYLLSSGVEHLDWIGLKTD